MTSMRYAATRADVLEFDLRMTADRQFVLMHDDTLDRTTTCTGRVRERTAADLRANCLVDQHGASEPVPTFDEVTAYARRVSKRIAPELNDAGLGRSDLAAADAVVRAHGWSSRTYLQSFYPAYFAGLRAVDRALTFVYLADRPTAPAAVRASGATIAGLKMAGLTSATVATFHRARVRVWAWTAADGAQLRTLWDMRVDGVVTDVPATARRMYHPG
jgi:glycerophosphoryl diester phosphodiesterase